MSRLRPAVFLDRDGTLNAQVVRDGRPYPPASVDAFHLLPGVANACHRLASAGYRLVVVTNQPDVGRGTQSLAAVEAMHRRLRQLVPEIVRIEVAYDPADTPDAVRRKPAPGMVLDAARALRLDLGRSWLVGDRWRDIECGRRAGVRTVFIDHGYDEPLTAPPDATVKSFAQAAAHILSQPGP